MCACVRVCVCVCACVCIRMPLCVLISTHEYVCIFLCDNIMMYSMSLGIPNFMVEVTGATDNGDGVYDVMLGVNFTITCNLSCPTNATVTWSQNDAVISSSEMMMMPSSLSVTYIRNNNGEIVESVLVRNMAELSDSGTYHCGTTVQTIQSNATADIFVYSKCLCTYKNYFYPLTTSYHKNSLLFVFSLVYTQYSHDMQLRKLIITMLNCLYILLS